MPRCDIRRGLHFGLSVLILLAEASLLIVEASAAGTGSKRALQCHLGPHGMRTFSQCLADSWAI